MFRAILPLCWALSTGVLILLVLPGALGNAEQVAALVGFKQRGVVDALGRLASWKASDSSPCRWEGVQCSSSIDGDVVGINISSRNLTGVLDFPADFCSSLPNLTSFAAGDNNFKGGFPEALLDCKNLVLLELQNNYLNGSLSVNLPRLRSLQHIDLSYNNFSGTVPAEWGDIGELRMLILWSCKMQGPLPPQLGKLSKLTNLALSYNNLGPSLPEELRNLSSLQLLKCGGCGLSGQIPTWIGDLTELEFLELTYNSLSGSIPPQIFLRLRKLIQLELYNNELTGPIPKSVGNLSSLTDIDLSSNFLTGSIPDELMNIPSLGLIHLWNNTLSGPIPRGISNLPNLHDVALFQNMLTGGIPPDLGTKCSMQIFDVSSNNLTGPVPAKLCNGGKLWRFILFQNNFTGGIPPEYGSCDSLIRVRIFGNSLSGEVPAGLWGKPSMIIFDISQNQLSGGISDQHLGQSQKLETLRIFENHLTGELPASVGMLRSLNQFMASDNQLSGRIPMQLGQCQNLTNLVLDGNRFDSAIPGEIGGLSKLQYLSLARNSLSGSIPGELGQLYNLISLDMSENELSGHIPPELGQLRLSEFTHFNISYNRLSGTVPFDVNSAVFGSSFIGNPDLCVDSGSCKRSPGESRSNRSRSPGVVAWIAGVVLAFAALVSFLASCWLYRKYKALANKEQSERSSRMDSTVWHLTPFQKLNFGEEEILASLDEDNVIGCGGAGKVYKATLKNGQCIAVKKLWSSTGKDRTLDYGFRAEVESLGRIRHFNIVRLLCVCSNGDTNILVYDYMANGSLGDLLHSGKASSVLDWPVRYRIALGAAHGLSYLHHDCTPQILHRDVKSNNILLSQDLDGMLADFGLAKLLDDDDGYSVSTLTGSLGYIAPEYAHKLKVNEKSDIYSFGVVLLELLTGRRPVDSGFGDEGTDIVRWVCGKIQSRNDVMSVFDSRIMGATPKDLMLVLKIALHCTSEIPASRPSMREVVRMLEEADPLADQSCCFDEKNKKQQQQQDEPLTTIKVIKP